MGAYPGPPGSARNCEQTYRCADSPLKLHGEEQGSEDVESGTHSELRTAAHVGLAAESRGLGGGNLNGAEKRNNGHSHEYDGGGVTNRSSGFVTRGKHTANSINRFR